MLHFYTPTSREELAVTDQSGLGRYPCSQGSNLRELVGTQQKEWEWSWIGWPESICHTTPYTYTHTLVSTHYTFMELIPSTPPTRPPKLKDECVWPRPWEAEQHIPLTSVTSLEIGTWIKPRQLGSIKAKNYMCCTRGLHLICLRVKPNVAERRANNENREEEMSSLWHYLILGLSSYMK